MSDIKESTPPLITASIKKSLDDQKAKLKLLKAGIDIQKKLGTDMTRVEKLTKSMERFVNDAIADFEKT